jgi:hypothetical protein
MDLWGNPRNLILKKKYIWEKKGEEKYEWIPYIIDFWQSDIMGDFSKEYANGLWPYQVWPNKKGHYSDSNICSYITKMVKQPDIVSDDIGKLENLWNIKKTTKKYSEQFLWKFELSSKDIYIDIDIEEFLQFLSDYAFDLRNTERQKVLTPTNKKEILRRLFGLTKEDLKVFQKKRKNWWEYDFPLFQEEYNRFFDAIFSKWRDEKWRD